MEIIPSDLKPALLDVFHANLCGFVSAAPGVGKSQIIEQIAKQYNRELIDFRLAQADPTDLQGFPTHDGNRMTYAPLKNMPLKGDPLPEGKDGWILFFDEMNSGAPSVQAAAYKVFLDRKVGDHKLHDQVWMVAAGNRMTDRAITYEISSALQSRLVHFNLSLSFDDWVDWAYDNGIDHRVIGFLNFRKELLHVFDPKTQKDDTYPCPRTWEFLSRLIKKHKALPDYLLPAMCGTIGEGTALEFNGFLEVYGSLPDIKEILKDPENAVVPQKLDTLHALTSLISHDNHVNDTPKLLPFIERLPADFQVLIMRACIRKVPQLLTNPAITKWKSRFGARLAGR